MEETNRERRMREEQEAAAAAAAERLQLQETLPEYTTTESSGLEAQEVEPPSDIPQVEEREAGLLTNIGNVIENTLTGDYLRPEDYEEREAARKQQVMEEGNFFEKAVYGTKENLEALQRGAVAGVMLPYSLVTELSGQATPWSSAPERIKESMIGNLIFEFAEVAVPTLLSGGMAGAALKGAVGARALRAGVETAAVQDLDQVILGRTAADKFAEIGEAAGFGDRDEIVRDLMAGRSLQSKAFYKTAGFIQSFIFDFGTDKFLGQVFKNYKPEPFVTKAAKAMGKTEDEMKQILGDTYEMVYDNLLEPEDVVTGNTITATVKTADGKEVNAAAFLAEMFRKTGQVAVGEDGLTAAGRKYYTNLDVINETTSIKRVVEDITEELPGLKNYDVELGEATKRAARFWKENERLFNENFPAFMNKFADNLTMPMYSGADKYTKGVDAYLRTGAVLDFTRPESFVITTMLAEEMSVKVAKLSTARNNLANLGLNTDMLDEEIVQQMKRAQFILIPLRRAKRAWSLAGKMQQRLTKEEVTRLIDEISIEALSGNEGIIAGDIIDELGNQRAVEDLLKLARSGDTNAQKTFNMLMAQLSMGDARQALETVEVGSEIIKKSLRDGRTDALTTLFYEVGLLSRIATQTTAVSNTIVRQILEPTALMATRLPLAPFSDSARREFLYGFGQLTGGFTHMGEAFGAMAKSFKTNQPITGTGRYKKQWESLYAKQNKLDATFMAARQTLRESNASPDEIFFTWGDYILQSIANNPVVNAPGRFLMSFDSAGQSTAFNGNLTGKAWLKAIDDGISVDDAYKQLRQEALPKGDLFKGIRDPELINVSKMQTFQRSITQGEDATIGSKFFSAVEKGTQEAGLLKFIAPFARISWDFLDQLRLGASMGLPALLSPTHKRMLSGELGVAMQMQAKSIIATSQLVTAFAVWRAAQGYMTGKVIGPGDTKDSFIVPWPGSKNGYFSVPYSKFQPYSAQMSVTADLVNSYRIGAISRGEYEKGLGEVTMSFIDNTFDQTTLTGLVNFADLVSRGAATKGWLSDLIEFGSPVISPAAGRMIGQIQSPAQKALIDRGSQLNTAAASLASKATGGLGLPIMHNVYTNEPMMTVATVTKGKDWAEAQRAALVNEFAWPGRIKDAYKGAGWYKLMEETGFSPSKRYLQEVNGIPLDQVSQSQLSEDIGKLGLGEKLTEYYESGRFQELWKDFQRTRTVNIPGGGIPGIPAPMTPDAQIILDMIYNDIEMIHEEVKIEAVETGQLSNNEEFMTRYNEKYNISTTFTPGPNDQGLYAMAAKQSSQLADQVRPILSIPT